MPLMLFCGLALFALTFAIDLLGAIQSGAPNAVHAYALSCCYYVAEHT